MKRITIATTMFLMLVLGIFSCSQEEIALSPSGGDGESKTEKEVIFRLAAPKAPQTRAIGEQQENTINTVMVLAFKVEADGTETYEYSGIGQKASGNIEGSATQNFNVTLKIKDYKQRFVVIANAKDEVTPLTGDPSAWVGVEKDVMLSKLEVSLGSAGDKWKTISALNYTAFPMWGESGQIIIISSTTSLADAVPLLRMIAKIDVQLDETKSVTDKFKIKSVYLYNTNTKGHVVPSSASVTEEIRDSKRYLTVTDPTIPTDIASYSKRYLGPLAYTDFDTPGKTDIAMRGAIYTFETAAPTSGNMLEATCLVVGGNYSEDGGATWDTGESYYRVDFLEDDKKTFRDILRNHQYDVNIVDVKGRGHGTPDDAFKSKGVNMVVDVLDWDNSGMNNIEFDGDHYLSVNRDSLYFYSEGRAQQLKVMTDYPDGWTIDPVDKSPWITVTPVSGAVNSMTEIGVTTTQLNIPEDDRDGYFYITAGRLKKKIKIVQTATPELTIEVTPTSLVFRKSGGSPKSIVVTTYPDDATIYFTDAPSANPIVWLAGSGFPVSGSLNITTYTFQPEPNTSNNPLNSSVVVYVKGTDGTVVSRSVSVVQLATDLLFEVINSSPYPATSGTYTFTVNSDTDWRVYGVDDSYNMLGNWSNANNDAGNGQIFSFTLTQNDTWDVRKSKFLVSSTNPDFAGQYIEIEQNYVNPSIALDKSVLDFGFSTSTTTQSVMVTSNAKWKFTATGDFAGAVSSSTPDEGEVGGNHTYHSTNTSNAVFTPNAWTAATGTPAAGSTSSANLLFTTTDHNLAPASTANLTITRTVPAFFTLEAPSATTAARGGATITVNASTNAAWNASSTNPVIATADQTATGYGTKSAALVIPENTAWSTTTTQESRTITVSAQYDNNVGTISTPGGTFTVTQPGNYISAAWTDLAALSAYSPTNVTVALTGAFPAISVKAYDVTNNADIVIGTIAAGEPSNSAILTVTPNASWAARAVWMQYYHPGTGIWTNIGTTGVIQDGYNPTLSAAGTPVGSSFNVTVTGNGYAPTLELRYVIDNVLIGGNTQLAEGTGVRQQIVVIPENPSFTSTRDVVIQYNRGGTWIPIQSFTQPTGNLVLSNGAIVAVSNTAPMTWAEAMGLPLNYNSQIYKANDLSPIIPVVLTGCGAYAEPNAGVGSWRAPTREEGIELLEKMNLRDQSLWCVWESMTAPRAYYVSFNSLATSAGYSFTNKTVINPTRCVR
ncbi:hypothetical protein [Parabacteroides sp.]